MVKVQRTRQCKGSAPNMTSASQSFLPRLRDDCRSGLRKTVRVRRSGNLSPRNVRSYIHKVSPTRNPARKSFLKATLPKHELNKDDTNGHAKVDRKKPTSPQPQSKNYRQLRNAESGRNSFPPGLIGYLTVGRTIQKGLGDMALLEVCHLGMGFKVSKACIIPS